MKESKKRVLIVLSYFRPYISGVSEYARMLAELLAPHYEVLVLTGQHDSSLPLEEKVNGYSITRARPLFSLHKGYISTDLIWKYRSMVKNVDLVNIHMPMLEAGTLAMLTPKTVPVIATYQCDVQPTGGLLDATAIATVNRSSKACLRRAEKIIVTSTDYAAGSPILREHSDRVVECFAPVKENTSLVGCDRVYRTQTDSFNVGFLGRFVKEKGIDILLQAAKSVIKTFPRTRFLLAGDHEGVAGGTNIEYLKPSISQLSGSVTLEGRLSDLALDEFYRSLDVFVLPSVNAYEAFGMVQIEAMLRGTPVIASDMRGVRVPIQRTGGGWLFEAGSPQALAATLINVAAGKFSKNRSEVARIASEMFSNDAFLDRYLRIFKNATEGLNGCAERYKHR